MSRSANCVVTLHHFNQHCLVTGWKHSLAESYNFVIVYSTAGSPLKQKFMQWNAGPALANRRPCSNCTSQSTSPFPLPSLLLSSLPLPLPAASPLKPARGSAVSSPSRILLHYMLAKRIWLQHLLFFGQRCNEWQKWKLIYTEFLGSKMTDPSLKSAAMFGRTPRTCLRPALVKCLIWPQMT